MTSWIVRSSFFLSALFCCGLFAVTPAQSTAPFTINGAVFDESAHGRPGISVCAVHTAEGVENLRDRICSVTVQEGKFIIDAAQTGTYRLYADSTDQGYMPQYLPLYQNPSISTLEVNLGPDNPHSSVNLTLGPRSGFITGKVIDEVSDLPVRDFVVWIYQARNPKANTHAVFDGSRLGRFKIFAPSVPFKMRIVAEGYEDWVMGGGALISAAGPRKGPGSLLVPAGITSEFAVYLKPKNQTSVEPKVTDETTLPAPVQLSPQDDAGLDVFPRATKLEWNPVNGAVSYAVEIEACWPPPSASRSRLPDDGECINPSPYIEKHELTNPSFEFLFKGAQPGRWRVWALDAQHRPGSKSPWRRFRHLR